MSFEIITAVCLRNLFWDKMLCHLVTCDVVKDNNSFIFTSLEVLKTQPPLPPSLVLYCLHLLIISITFYLYQTWILFSKQYISHKRHSFNNYYNTVQHLSVLQSFLIKKSHKMKNAYVHDQSAQLQCTVHSNLTQNSKPGENYKRWKVLLNRNTPETPQLTILRLPKLDFFFYLKHL